jgi:Uncharacterised nucleotidyltransferase
MNESVLLPNESEAPALDEASLLITCLRGLPFLVPEDADWHALLRLAEVHGVLVFAGQRFLAQGIEMPDSFMSAFREAKDAAEKIAAELESLLGHFDERGIEVLPLKGPVLAQMLYGDISMRTCDDLDLLVRHEDFERASSALLELGFVARNHADDYHRKFVRETLMVELHFRLASPRSYPFDLERLWICAYADGFRDKPIHMMSDEDLVLFLCLHGLKHRFSRLIWVLDIAQAFKRIRQENARELVESARAQGMEQVLLIGCEMIRETLQRPSREMDAIFAASPEMAEMARRAVQRIFAEGPEARYEPDIWSLYLRAERGLSARWRRRLSFLMPTSEDYAWAERNGVHRGLAPIARPLRLLYKHGLPKACRVLFPPPL